MHKFLNRLRKNLADSQEMVCSLGDHERARQAKLLYLFCCCAFVLLIILIFISFWEGRLAEGLVDSFLLLFLLFLLFFVRQSKRYCVACMMGGIVFLLFYVMLFFSGIAGQHAYIWYYTYPPMTLFLLGLFRGAILSILLLVITLILHLNANVMALYEPYETSFIIRFFLSYVGVFILSYISEKSRAVSSAKLKKALKEVEELAIRDGLTDLYNRRYFNEILPLLMREMYRMQESAAFLMIDIDYFKGYNDSYGHQAGDEALIRFAELLQELAVRRSDRVFRYGGEEFFLALLPTSRDRGVHVAGEILARTEAMAIPNRSSPSGIMTVSIGMVTTTVTSTHDYQALIATADQALYSAKENGRNQMVHIAR